MATSLVGAWDEYDRTVLIPEAEATARAARFCDGYKAGQSDARRSCGRGEYDGEYGRGYRLGYAWGLDHPLGSALLSEATS